MQTQRNRNPRGAYGPQERRARIHRIPLPAYHAQIDEPVLKPEYCRSGTRKEYRPPTQPTP